MNAGTEPSSEFESFNARSLRPEEVAKTFVPPSHFWTIVKPTHTLIVGPRGSGKTTLLKMLQQAALEAWPGDGAERARSQIDYTSVFVPTDRSWQVPLGTLQDSDQIAGRLSQAAFVTHVLRSLVSSLRHRTGQTADSSLHRFAHRRVELSREAEAELAVTLASSWLLSVRVQTLAGVHLALTERLLQVRMLALQQEDRVRRGQPIAALPDYAYFTFVEATAIGIEAFESISAIPAGKWALSFDELELAPASIREELIGAPRSVDERFIFKLSLSPFSRELSRLERPDAPAPGHDFESVQLSYPRKEDGYEFCRSLLAPMLEARGLPPAAAEEVFGRSVFSTDPASYSKGHTAYGPETALVREYKELAKRDESFRAYLQERDIDLDRLREKSHTQRAADVRKLRALVAVRNAYRRADSVESARPQGLRSRKAPALYAGADALFAAVEGNPRLFIGIIGGILGATHVNGRHYPIRREVQSREVEKASHRFLALLRTIPVIPGPRSGSQGRLRGVLDVIRLLGDAFKREIIAGPFVSEPYGSFTVDSNTGDDTVELLGLALNAGGIVYVPDPDGAEIVPSLRGKRFRLSYLISAAYGLPPRLDKAASISRLLADTQPAKGGDVINEPRLPGIG